MRRWGRVRSDVGVRLVAVERLAGGEVFWGPFLSVDEVIRFCELSGAVVSVVELSDPWVRVGGVG